MIKRFEHLDRPCVPSIYAYAELGYGFLQDTQNRPRSQYIEDTAQRPSCDGPERMPVGLARGQNLVGRDPSIQADRRARRCHNRSSS